ncbi:hypothetical protein HYS50_02705 [Candidatus Woesearchaeota archaeon]|nr:hypothetical protein [Candidatus Woesearchaeota archaeon]
MRMTEYIKNVRYDPPSGREHAQYSSASPLAYFTLEHLLERLHSESKHRPSYEARKSYG